MRIAALRVGEIAIGLVMGTMPAVASFADEATPAGLEASLFENPWIPTLHSNEFSNTEFRPRGHSLVPDPASLGQAVGSAESGATSAWQRLREFQAHNRVRLLTLWENSAHSLSIQAGRKGDPSLQWTMHGLHRDEATRGLFDRLFSVTVKGAGDGLRGRGPAAIQAMRSPEKAATGSGN